MSAARTVRIELAPSYRLAAVLCCAHLAAGASLLLVLPSALGALLTAGLAALGMASAWSRGLLAAPGSVRSIELAGDQVVLHLRDGRRVEALIAARRYVGRWLVTLPVRSPMRRSVLVTADMVRGDLFRVLRIWATWGRTPDRAARQAAV